MLWVHRYDFLSSVLAGHTVLDLMAASVPGLKLLAQRSRVVLVDGSIPDWSDPRTEPCLISARGATQLQLPADVSAIIVNLENLPAGISQAQLTHLLRQEAVELVAFVTNDDGGFLSPLAKAMGDRLAHVITFRQRPVVGSLISDERFSGARIAALGGPVGRHDLTPNASAIVVRSAKPLPPIRTGLFEAIFDLAPEVITAVHKTAQRPADRLDATPSNQIFDGTAIAAALRQPSHLADRLYALEDKLLALRMERNRLLHSLEEAQSNSGRSGGIGATPLTRQPWPLAETKGERPQTFGLYDIRPEDDVILEAQRGVNFLGRYGLDSKEPDFAGAVEAINGLERAMQVSVTEADPAPDVSIVIPVYGQLSYTLNCIESLLTHQTKYRVEIIIVDDCSPDETDKYMPSVEGMRYWRQPANGGFINSCNTGGQLSRGRYVVMLNNDVRVVAGWLDEMIDSFELFPRAGLVGSKLMYADGSLQEAGGIVWKDGSAWNYGRDDDPNRPQYCHARQVDYISGCAVALPTELWRKLEGFDRALAPAYYEDTDLAMRVREAGFEVWLQARSRIIHYEGKTSGTDVTKGVKAYQVINSKKFFRRWHEKLSTHRINGDSPQFERERNATRRVLIVDAVVPTPKQDAGSVNTLLTLDIYRSLGYKCYFVPQDNFLYDPRHTPALHRIGVETAFAPFDVDFETYMRRYGPLFDVIQVFRIGVLEKTIDAIRKFAPQAALLFHNADLHYLRMQRQAELSGLKSELDAAEEMKELEFRLMRAVDCTITHSLHEKELIDAEAIGTPVLVWPLMFEFEGTEVAYEARRDICFLGGYRHPPNIDAVQHFMDSIFPLIKEQEPAIRFTIAGAHPTPEIQALTGKDVVVTGMIDDLRTLFDTTRVFVCPLRIGAGVKGKVLAAMSYGVPLVSTSIGSEGLGLVEGEEVLVRDDPQAFADAVVKVYRDRSLWTRLSKGGQIYVQTNNSLDVGREMVRQAVELALDKKLAVI
jgi:GT2 family glycosyltransferase/glycosyltransferase involved in cell wall biosynthesis